MQVFMVPASSSTNPTARQSGQLVKDDFLRLLLAQMRNQDPLQPMDSTAFVTQLAQFTTLEKMQQLDDRMALLLEMEAVSLAHGLIGKEVEAVIDSSGSTIKGVVDSVKMAENGPVLLIGNRSVRLGDVVSVAEGPDRDRQE